MAARDLSPNQSLLLRHMPSLDSLRGVAVLMVVLFHGFGAYRWVHQFGPLWGNLWFAVVGIGRFGVNGFFVLSGFLITGILLRSRERPDYYRSFFLRRLLRILPAYLLLLLVLKLLHVIDLRFAFAAILFVANFSRLFGAPLTEYTPLWSIAVEEQFYLLWPACVRRFSERTLVRGLLAVIVCEPLLRLAAAHISAQIDIRYKTPFVLDFLAYGALLAFLVQSQRIDARNARRLGAGLLGLGCVLGALAVWAMAFHSGPTATVLEDLPFTWAACGLLLLGLARDHRRAERTGETRSFGFLPFFGYISYGLYLVHMLVYQLAQVFVLRYLAPGLVDSLGFFSAAVGVCILISTALAFLSRHYFEGPMLGLRQRWERAAPEIGPPAVLEPGRPL